MWRKGLMIQRCHTVARVTAVAWILSLPLKFPHVMGVLPHRLPKKAGGKEDGRAEEDPVDAKNPGENHPSAGESLQREGIMLVNKSWEK